MNLYSCLWQRGTPMEQPFALLLSGRMRLTGSPTVRRACAAYEALAGCSDERLASVMKDCQGAGFIEYERGTRQKRVRDVVSFGVQSALFLHCFPAFFDYSFGAVTAYPYSSCLLSLVDRKHVLLYFADDWWDTVYRTRQALTDDDKLVLGMWVIEETKHRTIVRSLDRESLTIHIEQQQQMANGAWQ